MKKIKIFSVFGTRPEAIKMCPLINEINKNELFENIVCVTAQHRQILDQILNSFDIKPKYDLDIMKTSQTLEDISSSILIKLSPIFELEKPNMVLVHGDTTTSFLSALSAFYKKIPIAHVEAGLRTHNIYSPYPEEANRILISKIADIHFAPTLLNKNNLIKENILEQKIFITGNTVIDSFKTTVTESYKFKNKILNTIDFNENKYILLTSHRRENIGAPLINICNAVNKISKIYRNIKFIYPVHPNPNIKNIVFPMLSENDDVYLIDPIDVEDMHNIINKCYIIITDSGGIQEEAPHFGIPVLVLRKETERQEAIQAGTVKLVGTDTDNIINEICELIENDKSYKNMSNSVNPYGDGNASQRIVKCILQYFLD